MPKIRLDDNPIRRLGWITSDGQFEFVEVGNEGVDEITYEEQYLGEYSICWLQVWKDGKLVARYNARNIDSIVYDK